MDYQKDIWGLMSKSVFGEASPEEQILLQELLQKNPELQQQYELLIHTLKKPALDNTVSTRTFETNEHIQDILVKAREREHPHDIAASKSLKRYISLAAASVIIIMVAGWFLFGEANRGGQDHVEPQTKPVVATLNGVRKQIVLPDGSKVWLNGGSKLFYDNDFKGLTREVTLEGEGFFDVVKDAGRPFIVHTGNINIKVLGTTFNVKAYTSEHNIETTLYTGLVTISSHHDDAFQPIMLSPNQKIIIPTDILQKGENDKNQQSPGAEEAQESIVVQQLDSAKTEPQRLETAWMYNRLEFKAENFETLAGKLQRWYDVKVIFEDETSKMLQFTGSFEKENIQQALLALSTANEFRYKINNNEIHISASK